MPSPWEESFRNGIEAFRSLDYQRALKLFDAAIAHGGERYIVYDSRAAVYEKIGKPKNSLKDSKKVIDLAPHLRHGYTRSARLFFLLGKYDRALEMVCLALDRIKPDDNARRMELEELKRNILKAQDVRTAEEAKKQPHMLKLPVELISETFIFAAEMDTRSPVCVSLVCSHWREIALSIPVLWGQLELSNIRPVRKMELWQERSKGRITSLRVCASISRLQLQDALAMCSFNFCKSLRSLHSGVDLVLLWSCLMNAPNFSDLDLDEICVSTPGLEWSPAPLIPFHRTSTRFLIVEYANVDWIEAIPRLAHLRTLVIRTSSELPSTALLRTFFGTNPHLREVTLEAGSPWEVVVIGTSERTALPNLELLELLGPLDASFLISRMFLPRLKRLVISQCLRAADEAIFQLAPAFPALTELGIHKCSFSEDRLSSFLQRMQTLTKLEITRSGSRVDTIVDAIAGSQNQKYGESGLVCPELQHVDFSHCPNLNGGPIVRLVKPRLHDETEEATGSSTDSPTAWPTRIRVLRIDGCPKVDPAVPQWLRSRVESVSCIYMTKQDIKKMSRRQGVYP